LPVFQEFGLLFVHIPKNAGRSIEEALLCGNGSPDAGRRSALNRVARGMQYWTRSRFAEQRLLGTLDVVVAAQHLTYAELELMDLLPKGISGSPMTSFCVCRNPFDRAVSTVAHFSQSGRRAPSDPAEFERALIDFLERTPRDHNQRAHRRTQLSFARSSTGKFAIDTVLRYENLGQDFQKLVSNLGRGDLSLPWHGRAHRARDYRDYFTVEARRLVEESYGEDIEAFKYAF
jgi:hypothetical protein